jgi:hypothetical protein
MKFPEWFYCKHTCILTALWEESPSEVLPLSSYSPVILPLSETFLEFLLWNSFHSLFSHFVYSESWNIRPFNAYFIFGNSQKSFWTKSGELGWCSISVMKFCAKNCLTESALWARALSWWRIQSLGQSLFYTQLHVTTTTKLGWLFGLVEWIQSQQCSWYWRT